jgi:hypothetical protein
MIDLSKLRLYKQAQHTGMTYRCAIGTNCYAKSLAYIHQLFELAKADYPTLTDDKIDIMVYGGDRRRKMYAIEFEVAELVEGYVETTLEPTLA